ncbi:hypothetical protein [Longispora albida]|uniref:hypothetical protein n=1 Tax=Longispora albida TaxID=203523 RepID=UPI000375B6BA|nr:hypothetical protein [Longispora albida]
MTGQPRQLVLDEPVVGALLRNKLIMIRTMAAQRGWRLLVPQQALDAWGAHFLHLAFKAPAADIGVFELVTAEPRLATAAELAAAWIADTTGLHDPVLGVIVAVAQTRNADAVVSSERRATALRRAYPALGVLPLEIPSLPRS